MTFRDKYLQSKTWQEKIMVMEMYHIVMCYKIKNWTISKTADYFDCSLGLVSENLQLGRAFHSDPNIMTCDTRQHALRKLPYEPR